MRDGTQSVLRTASRTELRRDLVEMVSSDLLGPAGGETEVLERERPIDRYVIGMIAPRGRSVEPEAEDSLVAGEEDPEEPADAEEPAQAGLFPSSIGMTFRVDGTCEELRVGAAWGRYARVRNPDRDAGGNVWQREPCAGELTLRLSEGDLRHLGAPVAECPDVRIDAAVRRIGDDWSVSLFLDNRQPETRTNADGAWLFQAELWAREPGGAPAFVAREHEDSTDDPERRRLAMAYRHRREFAVGHNTSVHADRDPRDPARAVRVATCALPRHEVAQMRPPVGEDLAALELDMARLGDASDSELPALLSPLPRAYRAWLAAQRARLEAGEDGLDAHEAEGRAALEDAERAAERIERGIALLAGDPTAARAFRFANRAMAMQRAHSLWAQDRRRGGTAPLTDFDVPGNRRWYPFQLAFMLLSLPSLSDPGHRDRSHPTEAVADLLWFPTGGGKTEAYLGLTAYTLALRRLQGPLGGLRAGAGVAVLMRYTLRVLTLQQFQRAAALVCACEVLRREDSASWGDEPFRIGLWVGQATSPNTIEQAAEAIRHAKGDWSPSGSGRPDQLTSCPWCGSDISPGRDIRVETYEKGRARVLTFCSERHGECAFSPREAAEEGLPVVTVDEEIYRRVPSVLVATVDKFAQLPWNGATQTLFGLVSGRCERHGFRSPELVDSDSHPTRGFLPAARTVERDVRLRPPDLVIQDELHLISGPLGTLVGLYETAVDELMSWSLDGERVRPKVIASTATIRRAPEQVLRLFMRRVSVFPPPALDAESTFFAQERDLEEEPGRLYLGVCAPGRRLKAVLIRVYLAMLASAQTLYERHGAAADPWMTLVGYFNSMRELAGMRRLCEDDVRTRLAKSDQRGLARRGLGPSSIEELTSRLSAAQIPERLDQMERGFDPAQDERRRRSPRSAPPRPLDVLLATNMISVGVDVRRLGLMVVAGQPKTTAEYIQATSRVGRQTPGVVCTVYNWARPRDLSHYERFEHYHASFYTHVEPLSVTPFAARARDRGLAALLVALVRLGGLGMSPNAAAQSFDPAGEECRRALEAIVRRAGEIEADKQLADRVREELERLIDLWASAAQQRMGSRLGYRDAKDSGTVGLLTRADGGEWRRFTALNSLRDVEPMVGLVLDGSDLYRGEQA